MPCPCGNVQKPNTNIVINENVVVEGSYGQTIEILLALRDKILCLNRNSSSEQRELYLQYIQEMLGENSPYKYNIMDFYYSIIYEQCD